MKALERLGLLYTLWRTPTPPGVILYVTARCNQKCGMCFYWRQTEGCREEAELTLDELEKISLGFSDIVQLSLTGGEPFLREDLCEIVSIFAKNNRVPYITIPTNGSLPDRIPEMAGRMLRENPRTVIRIVLSIDGIEEAHDRIRGMAGAYKKLLATYEALLPLRAGHGNLLIDMNTVYSRLNEGRAQELFEWVKANFRVDNYSVTYVRGDTRDQAAAAAGPGGYLALCKRLAVPLTGCDARPWHGLLRAVADESRRIIADTLLNRRSRLPCLAGEKMVVISETGRVFPCELLPRKLGDLRCDGYDIKKILGGAESASIRGYIEKTKCSCTFECAVTGNLVFHWPSYTGLLARAASEKIKILFHP